MTVCRFFLQGYCRYGSSCRFEHSNNDPYRYANYGNAGSRPSHTVPTPATNTASGNVTTDQLVTQVTADVNAAINGRQWILSAYAPFKSKPNFPGFHDISPEELRLQFYESRAKGTTSQTENEIARMQTETFEKMKSLVKPNRMLIDIIESLYRNENPKDPFHSGSIGFAQNSNTFNPNSNTIINQPQPNVFGSSTMTNSPASSLFANAAKNLFQNPSSVNINSTPSFGGGFQMESAQMTEGFGVSNQQPNPAFGMVASNQSAQSFQNNIFAPPQNNFSVFGNSQSNAFAQPTAVISPSALFSSANKALDQSPSTFSNIFGQSSPLEHNNINNPQYSNANPFLNSAPSNPFGMPNSANVFGSTSETNVEGIYSKLEELSKEEIEAYKSDSFQRGFIPENPPALELCN